MRRLVIALAAVFTFGCGSNPTAAPAPVAPAAVRPYVVDTVATGLRNPWSLAFLPDGAMLVTEKYGTLRLFTPKADRGEPVEGGPVAWQFEDGGLLDVVIDPDFAHSRLLYLSFSEGDSAANHTAVFRARLEGRRLVDGRVIFRASPDKRGAGHPGGRLLFLPDQTLLLTIGDGYDFRDQAQRLNSDLGKVVRLDRDGRPAPGNPFADSAGARPEIYSLGHRNPQGLLIDPRDGTIWEHEHGPKGGDEINHLRPGRNYGWPRTTFGVDYSGALVPTSKRPRGSSRRSRSGSRPSRRRDSRCIWATPFPPGAETSSSARSRNEVSTGCASGTARWCCRRRSSGSSRHASATCGAARTGCSTC